MNSYWFTAQIFSLCYASYGDSGNAVLIEESKHKVPPAYSRAGDCARSLNGRRDDDSK
jgi:hypothetical protein